jgi:metal-sulfur cluster biosynthetic enzyme
MPEMVRQAVLKAKGVASAEVELVWSPRWDKSRMSEVALLELGLM